MPAGYGCGLTYEHRAGDATHGAQCWLAAKDQSDAEHIAASQLRGATRTIVYDPAEPADYLFERASALRGLVWLLPFAGFAGFGALTVCTTLRFCAEQGRAREGLYSGTRRSRIRRWLAPRPGRIGALLAAQEVASQRMV